MSEKTAKIVKTTFVKEWINQQGQPVYYHIIELDNKDSGQIGTKERLPDKLSVGQELTYTIESSSYGNKIKAVSAASGPGYKGGKPQRDPKEQMISFATAYTKDLIVAGKIDIKDLEPAVKRMYQVMKSLYEQ